MYKRLLSVCLSIVLLFSLFVTPVLATVTASDQINSYVTSVSAAGNGQIAIKATVNGKRLMTSIGMEEIKIYKQNGSLWSPVKTYDKDDEGMYYSSTQRYNNTIYYSGTVGSYYKIEVTVFAEDSSGSDSRADTWYVTAR